MNLSCERLLILLALYQRRKQRRYRERFWVRMIFAERKEKGEYNDFVREMGLPDHEFFFKMFRMTPSQLEEVYSPRIVELKSPHRSL